MEVTEQLQGLTPVDAARAGATSLMLYGKIFFPRTFRQKSPAMHEEIGQALYSNARFNAFEIFRDGAKTSLLRVYTSQRVAYAISRTIMYVSVSQQHAMFSVRWLRRQVEFNTRWAQTFGLTKGSKWTDEWAEIIHANMKNPDGTPVTITVLAMGITGQIRGFNPDDYRPDLIIIDDILNEENTATPEQRKKIDDLLFGALLNSLSPSSESPMAKAVFLQTPFNKHDAIQKCMGDPSWNPKHFGVFDERNESRWPERYSTKDLLAQKEAHIRRGQYRLWMREKECTIVSGEEKAIDVTKFKTYDVLPESFSDILLAIDPASSDSEGADDFAIVALGFRGADVYVLDYHLAKGVMPDKAANDFFTLMLMYHPRKAAVETVGYQRILKWYLEQEMTKRRLFLPIEAIQDRRTKANRIMQAIPGLTSYGHFFIRAGMVELVEQADDYDPNVKDQPDDLLDAIATGITVSNPALRGNFIEGEYSVVEDETDYKPIRLRAAP